MTATLGAPAAPARIDTALIRRTYAAVLGDPRIGAPHLAEEQRAHLAGLLRGHMRLLLPTVEEQVPGIVSTFNRGAAQHVVDRVRAVLAVPVVGASSAEYVYDLATLSRVLLTLHRPAAYGADGPPDSRPAPGGTGSPGRRPAAG
jgi:hypothetical protein